MFWLHWRRDPAPLDEDAVRLVTVVNDILPQPQPTNYTARYRLNPCAINIAAPDDPFVCAYCGDNLPH